MRRTAILGVFYFLVCTISACAPGSNTAIDTVDEHGIVAGFGRGYWHGMIMPVAFVVSLFDDDIGIYEPHNIGHWYDLGFLLGLSAALGGSCGAGGRWGRGGGDSE
jgi:hypothetical protein